MNPSLYILINWQASLVAQLWKIPLPMQETQVWSLGWEESLEKEVGTHSSILAWKIPWIEKPGRIHGIVKESGLVTSQQH